MDNSAGNLPDDIKPDIRPSIRSGQEKIASPDTLKSAEENQSSNTTTEASHTSAVDNAESNQLNRHTHDDTIGDGYNANDTSKSFFSRFGFQGSSRKRGGIIAGLIISLLFGGSMGLSILSGPFQFVHIAQLLQRAHLSHQQSAGDNRLGRLFRFVKSSGDAGETRLGYLGSKYKNRIITQLDDIGLKPQFGRNSIYKGFAIDKENAKSPYHGMSDEEIKAMFAEKGLTVTGTGANLQVEASSKKSLRILIGELNDSKFTTAVRVRVLAKYGLVSWHPLKVLDRKINEKISSIYDTWNKQRIAATEGETTPSTIETKTTDKKGKVISTTDTTPTSSETKSILGNLGESSGLKAAGGVAAVVGLVCLANTIDTHAGLIKYAQVVAPLMRMGMDTITTGNQIMSGYDVDPNELSILSKQFNQYDANGNFVSNWSDAKSIQSVEGVPQTGTDQIKTGNYFGKGFAFLNWTQQPFIQATCSKVGQAITGVGSFLISIATGEIASFAVSALASTVLAPTAVNQIAHVIAGHAIDVASAAGSNWGNDVNYGSLIAGNTMALQFGGTALNTQQVAQLTADQNAASQASFQSKSLAYRLFNPYNSRTLVSHILDGQNPNPTQNIASMFNSFLTLGSTIVKLPGTIFSSMVHATPQPYNYGIPEYGFSDSELANKAVANPYTNASQAAAILNTPCTNKNKNNCRKYYIQQAKECFGVDIQKVVGSDGVARWDVIPGKPPTNVYTKTGTTYSSTCTAVHQLQNTNWLHIRFFIFDTGIMEGYTCVEGDATSCINDGFSSSEASPSNGSPSNSGTSSISGYKNPLRTISGLTPMRIDQGVDYGGTGQVYAIGNGTVVAATSNDAGWPGGTYISYTLNSGAAAGKTVYVAENCTNVQVKPGETVTSNTALCTMHNTWPYIETGWSEPNSNQALAHTVYQEGAVTAYGNNFSAFMKQLGAPGGTVSTKPIVGTLPSGWPTW